ncbi:MAG: ABC transporter ATP-binding protein [Actinomycetota bacterium]
MTTAPDGIQVENLVVRFGGLVAVNDVTLTARLGRITALIGPNGAGKTTTFNACTGLVRPTSGHVRLDGRDVTRMSPAHRARLGLGRTFQRMELFESLPVRDNVALGREALVAGAKPWRHLRSARSARADAIARADEAMTRCGITTLAGRRPAELSTGQRRLVELARATASGARMLLLDEPSSGLDRAETQAFGEILESLVAGGDVGILIVEHDMALIMRICNYGYVLDFGRLIFTGTAAEIAASDIVRAAYLGSQEVEVAV